MPLPTKDYIMLVDSHRPMSLTQRPEKGRYRIGARSAREAEKFLKAKIKQGHIQVYYIDERPAIPTPRGKIIKEDPNRPFPGL